MATLQKFKLFAAQCGVAPSPTRSPGASPVVQLRRQSQQKTTLRMLFTRGGGIGARGVDAIEPRRSFDTPEAGREQKKKSASGRTLKDLFVSPPPSPERDDDGSGGARGNGRLGEEEMFPFHAGNLGSLIAGPSSPRPVFMGLQLRSLMLRKAWRPTLETIDHS